MESVVRLEPEVRELRRRLHQRPELAFAERETARAAREFLGELPPGTQVEEAVGETGFVVTLAPEASGPCVALRADMDALPLEEQSGVPWASRIPGVMHACGHDGHTAVLAGVGRLLKERVGELAGPVKLIFQPGEEGAGGGRVLCEAGVLENPAVDAIYGWHNNLPGPDWPLGSIAYAPGAAMAGTGLFRAEVVGCGGHAAFPHRCVDPLYVAAQVVGQLQSLISRELDPLAAGVVSVTWIRGGTADNIIADRCRFGGTFRALDEGVLRWLEGAIAERIGAVARAHGAKAEVECRADYPVLVNDARAEAVFRGIVEEIGDADKLREAPPIMGGEDFAYYAGRVPGFFWWLPACPAGTERVAGCHEAGYDFNDALIGPAMRLMAETGLRFAQHWEARHRA